MAKQADVDQQAAQQAATAQAAASIKAALNSQKALAFQQGARGAARHAWPQTTQVYPA